MKLTYKNHKIHENGTCPKLYGTCPKQKRQNILVKKFEKEFEFWNSCEPDKRKNMLSIKKNITKTLKKSEMDMYILCLCKTT